MTTFDNETHKTAVLAVQKYFKNDSSAGLEKISASDRRELAAMLLSDIRDKIPMENKIEFCKYASDWWKSAKDWWSKLDEQTQGTILGGGAGALLGGVTGGVAQGGRGVLPGMLLGGGMGAAGGRWGGVMPHIGGFYNKHIAGVDSPWMRGVLGADNTTLTPTPYKVN